MHIFGSYSETFQFRRFGERPNLMSTTPRPTLTNSGTTVVSLTLRNTILSPSERLLSPDSLNLMSSPYLSTFLILFTHQSLYTDVSLKILSLAHRSSYSTFLYRLPPKALPRSEFSFNLCAGR